MNMYEKHETEIITFEDSNVFTGFEGPTFSVEEEEEAAEGWDG